MAIQQNPLVNTAQVAPQQLTGKALMAQRVAAGQPAQQPVTNSANQLQQSVAPLDVNAAYAQKQAQKRAQQGGVGIASKTTTTTPAAPVTPTVTPAPAPVVPPATPTNTIAASEQASIDNSQAAAVAAKSASEATSNAIKEQVKTAGETTDAQISSEQKYATDKAALDASRITQLQKQQVEYETEKQRQADVATQTLQPLKDTEVKQNQAAVDKATAQQEADINQAKIDNEVNMQMSKIALSKLGLSMSTAGITAVQSLAQQGALNIAKIKTDATYNLAALQKDMNRVEFEHQVKINDIINNSHDAVLQSREKTLNSINAVQNNILLTEKEKNTKIAELKNSYAQSKVDAMVKMQSNIIATNAEVSKQLEAVTVKKKALAEDGKARLNELILSSTWDKLSPSQKQEYASQAGITLQEAEGQKSSTIYSAITAGLQAYIPEGVISPASLKKVSDYANSLMATGMTAKEAILKAVVANAAALPEYVAYRAKVDEKAKLESEKTKADIGLTKAKTTSELSNAAVNQGELAIKAKLTNAQISEIESQVRLNDSSVTKVFQDATTGNIYSYGKSGLQLVDTAKLQAEQEASKDFSRNIQLERPEGSTNVGSDTNNPGNITTNVPAGYTVESYGKLIGAIGTYTSPNKIEYYVFPSMDAGKKAHMADIVAKQTGKSQTGLGPNSTLKEFIQKYVGSDSKGYEAVAAKYGIGTYTKIGDIPTETLYNISRGGEGAGSSDAAGVSKFMQGKAAAIEAKTKSEVIKGTGGLPTLLNSADFNTNVQVSDSVKKDLTDIAKDGKMTDEEKINKAKQLLIDKGYKSPLTDKDAQSFNSADWSGKKKFLTDKIKQYDKYDTDISTKKKELQDAFNLIDDSNWNVNNKDIYFQEVKDKDGKTKMYEVYAAEGGSDVKLGEIQTGVKMK